MDKLDQALELLSFIRRYNLSDYDYRRLSQAIRLLKEVKEENE